MIQQQTDCVRTVFASTAFQGSKSSGAGHCFPATKIAQQQIVGEMCGISFLRHWMHTWFLTCSNALRMLTFFPLFQLERINCMQKWTPFYWMNVLLFVFTSSHNGQGNTEHAECTTKFPLPIKRMHNEARDEDETGRNVKNAMCDTGYRLYCSCVSRQMCTSKNVRILHNIVHGCMFLFTIMNLLLLQIYFSAFCSSFASRSCA